VVLEEPKPLFDPKKDCYALASWVGSRGGVCAGGGMRGDLAAKWLGDKIIDAIMCESVVDVYDHEQLWGECKDAIAVMSCDEVFSGGAPEPCRGQFIVE